MKKQWYIDKITRQIENRTKHSKEVLKSLSLNSMTLEQLKGFSFVATLMEISAESSKGFKNILQKQGALK